MARRARPVAGRPFTFLLQEVWIFSERVIGALWAYAILALCLGGGAFIFRGTWYKMTVHVARDFCTGLLRPKAHPWSMNGECNGEGSRR